MFYALNTAVRPTSELVGQTKACPGTIWQLFIAQVLNIFAWHASALKQPSNPAARLPVCSNSQPYNNPIWQARNLQIQSDSLSIHVGPDPGLATITTTPNSINKCRNYY